MSDNGLNGDRPRFSDSILSEEDRAVLIAHLEGAASPAEEAEARRLLEREPGARRELESLRAAWNCLDHLPPPEPSASDRVLTRTLSALEIPPLGASTTSPAVPLDRAAPRRTTGSAEPVATTTTTTTGRNRLDEPRERRGRAARWLATAAIAMLGVWIGARAIPNSSDKLARNLRLAEYFEVYRSLEPEPAIPWLIGAADADIDPEANSDPEGGGAPPRGESNPRRELAEARERLRAMPPSVRRALGERFEKLETLPADEAARLRAWDAAVGALPPERRAETLERLRARAVWRDGLERSDREALDRAAASGDPRAWLAETDAIRDRRESESRQASGFAAGAPPLANGGPGRNSLIEQARELSLDFGAFSPAVFAACLEVWEGLDATEKTRIEKTFGDDRRGLVRELLEIGRTRGVEPRTPPLPRFRQARVDAAVSKIQEAIEARAGRPTPPAIRAFATARTRDLLATVAAPPPPMSDEEAAALHRALPDWAKGVFDDMTPRTARRALEAAAIRTPSTGGGADPRSHNGPGIGNARAR